MSKQSFLVLIFSVFISGLLAQDYANIHKALEAESKYNYTRAIKLYNCALIDDPNNQYLHYKIGKNYFNMNNYEAAVNHMEMASEVMKDSMKYHFDMYHLYTVLGYNALAKESFIQYINLCPSCVEKDLIPGGESNKLIYRKPVNEPQLMGYETNKTEFYPYIINDNQIQLLNIKGHKSKPTKATNFSEYLTYYYSNHDFMFFDVHQYKQINRFDGYKYGPFSLNKALDKVYITRLDPNTDRMFIYFSKRMETEDLAWDRHQQLEIEIDKGGYNYIHPMLSADETHLIFASNQPGGLGGYDLWIGEIVNDTKLTNVKNLGTYVNTPGDECFPTIYDDKVIFFASNGHYGYGNLDMYAGIQSKGGRYMKTYNLGSEFNSPDDDYALFYDHKKSTAFFTSNRFKNSDYGYSYDRIYKQSFGKTKATISIKDDLNRPVSGMKISIPSEKIDTKTNENGQAIVNVNPVGFKKLVASSDDYNLLEANLLPFQRSLDLIAARKFPKDAISFSLLSFPFEHVYPNVFYKITNPTDCSNYSGYTDESGMGQVVMYPNEEYRVEVPELGFVSPKMKFDKASVNKIFVSNDNPDPVMLNTPVKEVKTIAEPITLSDHFTIYYETSQWLITDEVNKQMQNVIKQLNQNPNYRLELSSHTDCRGDAAFNLSLSRQRLAEAIKLFFQRGANDNQIIGKYYGETKPLNNCHCDANDNYDCPSNEIAKNRRTEVRLIKQ